MKEAIFFLEETQALAGLLDDQRPDFDQSTLFKGWSIDNVLRHLHFWNEAARTSLEDEKQFTELLQAAFPIIASKGLRQYEDERLADLSGATLLSAWLEEAERTSKAFEAADPDRRLPWAGPPMSARSSISARLMETWAHAQAVYDLCGVDRVNTDRIYPIAELGVRTFGWTYSVRGQEKPPSKPHLRLTAPSGDVWTFNDERDDERIEGAAAEFCQVVTQTRNIDDVSLTVIGPIATDWMSKAQCFAGAPETPPAPGTRRKSG